MRYTEYRCEACEFATKNKTNFSRHCNLPKHFKKVNIEANILNERPNVTPPHPTQKKVQKVNDVINLEINDVIRQEFINKDHICEHCHNSFTRSSSLTRHKKICLENKIKNEEYEKKILKKDLDAKLNEKNLEIKLFEKGLEAKLNESELKLKYEQELHKKDIEKFEMCKKEMEYYKGIINMAGGMVQKTVSALTFIVNTYDGAPVIKQITFNDVRESTKIDDEKMISKIFYHYNRNKLNQYIGDIIVEIYKKKDPSEQSIWSTDTSRLTYLLKKILHDDNSKWMVDKKGVDTIDCLITPIFDRVREMAIDYQENNCFGDNLDPVKVLLINDIFSRLMIDIDNKKIHNDILKYIAPHFYLNVNRTIEDD